MEKQKFFEVLIDKNNQKNINVNWEYIYSFPEFAVLKETHQSPKWHGEGDFVSTHIELVVRHAAILIETIINIPENTAWEDRDTEVLMLAAIFHDIGKSNTTFFKEQDQMWHHYNHEITGEKITRRILWDIVDPLIREDVCSLVRWHMEPLNLARKKDNIELVAKMFELSNKVCSLALLWFLKECDILGSVPNDPECVKADFQRMEHLMEISKELGFTAYSPHPCINEIGFLHKLNAKTANTPSVTVMVGLPGAGKDYFIKNTYRNQTILCRDDIRIELGYCKPDEKYLGTPHEEDEVTRIFNERLIEAVKEGKDVVINNTNLKRKYRDGYKKLLNKFNVQFNCVIIEARGINKNIERRKGQISEDIIREMIEKYEHPTYNEFDDITFIIN